LVLLENAGRKIPIANPAAVTELTGILADGQFADRTDAVEFGATLADRLFAQHGGGFQPVEFAGDQGLAGYTSRRTLSGKGFRPGQAQPADQQIKTRHWSLS